MKTCSARALVGVLVAAVACTLPHHAAGQASADLSGMNQSPPINTATYGNWSAMLDGDRMVWELAVYNADAATMAHIHQGGPTDSGPVIVFLVPVGVGSAATTQDLPQLSQPLSGDRTWTGSFTAADFGGPAAGQSMQWLVDQFQNNRAYVNVHSVQYPAGVIRGQVVYE